MVGNRALLIFSGGLDSTTLLYKLLDDGYQVETITFNYGQRHSKELEAVYTILEDLRASGFLIPNDNVINLENVGELLAAGNSSLISSSPIPDCHYTAESAKKTVVPGRNLIMLSIAAGIAEARNIPVVFYGAHNGDAAIYPDTRPPFVNAINAAVQTSSAWNPVSIIAPFLYLTKAQIVEVGLKLGVPYEKTWSCYNGREKPCGTCPTCIERLEAFQLNGVSDPLQYE